jgi:hypothetical protein
VGGQCHIPPALPPRKRASTYCTGVEGPRAGLDRAENLTPHQDLIPGPSSL